MTQFPTPKALASGAGVAPGNNESAGKNLSGATTHGNTWAAPNFPDSCYRS